MADDTLTLTLDSGGDVVIKLRPDLAPGHVARIVDNTKEGFYDGVVFHRVIPGFMAQGGDPTGTGMGGHPDKPDLKAEFSRQPHVRGVCSMARASRGLAFRWVVGRFWMTSLTWKSSGAGRGGTVSRVL